jgi:putative FmdB family regulatory protein
MPIYAYRCDTCGHAKDVLQKISDPVLSACPACGAGTFHKQVTAAGFQLKGSGWYVTDFKSGGSAPAAAKPADAAAPAAADTKPTSGGSGSDPGSGGSSSAGGGGAAPAKSAAGGCGSACGCH